MFKKPLVIIFSTVFIIFTGLIVISACEGRTPPVAPVPVDISLNLASTRSNIIDADAQDGSGNFGQGNATSIGSGNSEINSIKDINLKGGTLFLSSDAQSVKTQQATLEVDFKMWVSAGKLKHKEDPSLIAVGEPDITWTTKAQKVTGNSPVYDFDPKINGFKAAENVLDPVINSNYTAYVSFTLKDISRSYALSLEELTLNLEASKDLENKTLIQPEASSSSTAAPKIIGFEAIPTNILQLGESTTLRWWVSGGQTPLKLSIDNIKNPDVTDKTQVEISPIETTVYTLTVTDSANKKTTKAIEILVGDAPSNVEQLIELMRKGGRVEIPAGEYVLTEPLTLDNDVELIGAGRDKTFITSNTGDEVLKFKAAKKFSASGISFKHTGTNSANVIQIIDGRIDISDCSFIGTADATGGGVGLWLTSSTSGTVKNSIIENNRWGIQINNAAHPNLEGNTIRNNKELGISYFEATGGTAKGNFIENNGLVGISVEGSASPRLELNIIRNNRINESTGTGIAYYNNTQTGGRAIKNTIEGSYDGIAVEGIATPRLEENTLKDNERWGIIIVVPANPEVKDNVFIGNKFGDIHIFDPSEQP